MKTLHHKSKRYELQQYSHRNLTWYPVKHTNKTDRALDLLEYSVKQGYFTRIVDRISGGVVEAGRPTHPKYQCELCADTKEVIIDSADYRGEHVQTVQPCECTL